MRVVFDTNVLIAAFITEGLCSAILTRARKKEFELFICPKILEEFKKILSEKLKAPQNLIKEALDIILEASKEIYSVENIQGICRDQDDDQIISCAASAKADYLVSGDKDLLEMATFKGIKIISPRAFEILFED